MPPPGAPHAPHHAAVARDGGDVHRGEPPGAPRLGVATRGAEALRDAHVAQLRCDAQRRAAVAAAHLGLRARLAEALNDGRVAEAGGRLARLRGGKRRAAAAAARRRSRARMTGGEDEASDANLPTRKSDMFVI